MKNDIVKAMLGVLTIPIIMMSFLGWVSLILWV